ncbi:MAG3720 family protein [Mycoplasmopsis fermentans]|nr:hypothetical protein [Mycoplasmopsis fermentans]ADN69020.1 hypothetical protein MFE_04240 [Mycoplasmopsis fermentans JER]ADV34529.1 Conserved Hypothetical Protein [Mycoplasmopsis fermentans M64]VEU64085.1 Uncharacterised protein [Mycoplasmopsis fermentans]VEU66724.1 Uncharacterised protein [Mesomycoplasma conjunctivae]
MKKIYVNFFLKKTRLDVTVVEDINSKYFPVFQTYLETKNFEANKIKEFITNFKKYLKSKVATKKNDVVKYSFIVKDSLYKSLKFVNQTLTFDVPSNTVDQQVWKEVKNKLEEQKESSTYELINSNIYLYETINNDVVKSYSTFPWNKQALKLNINQGLFVITKDTWLAKIINIIKECNLKLDALLLESQALSANLEEKDKAKYLFHFDWNALVVNGSMNAKTFFYEKSNIDFKNFVNYLSKELNKSKEDTILLLEAVVANWKVYQVLNDETEGYKAYRLVISLFDQAIHKVKAFLDQNNQKVDELVLNCKNSEIFMDRFNKLYPEMNVAILDDNVSTLFNIPNSLLGIINLLNPEKINCEDMVNTLNNLPEYKPKSFWNKLFSWILPSQRAQK